RMIYLGQKLDDISEKYFNNKDKKTLIGEILKTVEIENSKRKKLLPKEKKEKEQKEKQVLKEVEIKVEQIREEKKTQKQKAKQEELNKPKIPLKVGDRTRMIDGKAIGTIDKSEKNKATVNYGLFNSIVSLDKLEKV